MATIHAGHRKRVKERFRLEGLDHFNEINVLELLLFYSIPRSDTNVLAHRLLDTFGSVTGVLEAPVEELMRVPGIGENSSTLIALVSSLSRYYLTKRSAQQETVLDTTQKCARYLIPRFVGRRNELVLLLCLNAKCEVICCKELSEGSVGSAGVSARQIMEIAFSCGAQSVVLSHNHPNGVPLPSPDDIQTTQRLVATLDGAELILADHIIVAGQEYISMAQSGLLRSRRRVTAL